MCSIIVTCAWRCALVCAEQADMCVPSLKGPVGVAALLHFADITPVPEFEHFGVHSHEV